MATTITIQDGSDRTTSPLLILEYQTSRAGRSIIHDLISGDIAVTLIPGRPRSGALRLLYQAETDAVDALNLHSEEAAFRLTTDERDRISMSYVVAGDVTLTLDDDTRALWALDVDYQEVTP